MLDDMEFDGFEPEQIRRLTRQEFERLGDLHFFQDERVELLWGLVIRMGDPGPAHENVVARLLRRLVPPLVDRAEVRCASPFAAGDHSLPKPDVAVVPLKEYGERRPDEAFFIVEVSDTRLSYDRNAKARLYASAGIPEYWVVNIPERLIEVRDRIESAAYARTRVFRAGESVSPGAFPDVALDVAEILASGN